MSSHHFVKEGQEPALLIVEPLSLELVEPLLEWAPLILVIDSALKDVLNWGIKIDVVLSRIDRMDNLKDLVQEQAPVKLLSYLLEDDPIATAFYFLIDLQQKAVNVIGEESIFNRVQNFTSQINIGLLNTHLHWSAMRSGIFEKWLPANTTLQIRPPHQGFHVVGLEHQGDCLKTLEDGIVRIQSEDMFWVGESV